MAAYDPFDPASYTYSWPLEGYENQPPLSEEKNEDGKSIRNEVNVKLSSAYEEFPDPLNRGRRGGFDIHIYYSTENEEQTKYAKALWERIRREFPELRIYRFWDKPVGPHTMAMFEVNLFTPAQFGAFVPWLAIWRGPLSALIHPNTTEQDVDVAERELRNHTQRATWMGERVPVKAEVFTNAVVVKQNAASSA